MNGTSAFVIKCSTCFKTFDYSVNITKNNQDPWSFLTKASRKDKKYAVLCVSSINTLKDKFVDLLAKIPQNHRLVVVTLEENNEEQLYAAQMNDYCLTSLAVLNRFGEQMLEIKNMELVTKINTSKTINSKEAPSEDSCNTSFVDKVISKKRIF